MIWYLATCDLCSRVKPQSTVSMPTLHPPCTVEQQTGVFMKIKPNQFKQALRDGPQQIGLWAGFANPYSAEALAGTGYDWLLFDGEHAPNDVRTVLAQLQAVAPYPVHPIVRPAIGEVALIKQFLDLGVQTLLIPLIETAAQAEQMVRATRYPPAGIRGVGSVLARCSRWNQVDDYVQQADQQMCVLIQVETETGLSNVDAIATVEGVDGVFFGPADLSASMGHLGHAEHADVQQAIAEGIASVLKANKAPGILSTDPHQAQCYLNAGAKFVAVGLDTALLIAAATQRRQQFKPDTQHVDR